MMNNKNQRATRISDEDWEQYRCEIVKLYVEEGKELQGDAGVIKIMEKQHGFTASKSQYEHRFAKWGIRKNLKRKEWPEVIQAVEKRKRLGKESEVHFNGYEITKERIERETARYRPVLNTLEGAQEDRSELPKGVLVCTPQMASPISEMIPASPKPSSTMITISTDSTYPWTISGWDRILTPVLAPEHLEIFFSSANCAPFGWAQRLDWTRLPTFGTQDDQLVRISKTEVDRLSILMYPKYQELPIQASQRSSIPQYLVSALLNNIELPGSPSLMDIHRWLRRLPQAAVFEFFEALPSHVMAVLRDRVFIAACKDGDESTVHAMLDLGANPLQPVPTAYMRGSASFYGILRDSSFSVVKTIVAHVCGSHTRINPNAVLTEIMWRSTFYLSKLFFTEPQWIEILGMLFSSGAKPTLQCIEKSTEISDHLSLELLELVLGSLNEGIPGWLRDGLLNHCFERLNSSRNYNLNERKPQDLLWAILTRFFEESGHLIPKNDPQIEKEIWSAFSSALKEPDTRATKLIFEACSSLGIQLHASAWDETVCDSILEACSNGDWVLAHELVPRMQQKGKERGCEHNKEQLGSAISGNNITYVNEVLQCKNHHRRSFSWGALIDRAASCGHDGVALAIINSSSLWATDSHAITTLLRHSRITAISLLLESDELWIQALRNAHTHGDYVMLDDLLFRGYGTSFERPFSREFQYSVKQIALRALSYRAIQTCDTALLRWLIDVGLEMEELQYGEIYQEEHLLPSLLFVCIDQNNQKMLQFLLAEGVEDGGSSALIRAVESKANPATVKMLLDNSKVRPRRKHAGYASFALRKAIHERHYDMICSLAENSDVQHLQPVRLSNDDLRHLKRGGSDEETVTSPLGEAILQSDLKAITILLAHGCSPNALVTYRGEKLIRENQDRSILCRMTPLLVAIDMQSIGAVEILIKHGADIDYQPHLGLLRTPLQRAAEMGSFDIVQYLLERGAPADSPPFYNGGTPLQLAAMEGYVGIASLLLEWDANVNFPPASGEGGRTAFEAAAEKGRIDMLSFLVQKGVNLDLVVGEDYGYFQPGRGTQYHRAIKYADRTGEIATKNFIEHLYQEMRTRPGALSQDSPLDTALQDDDYLLEQFFNLE